MEDTTLSIPAGSPLDKELDRVANATGKSKAEIALDAIADWLEERNEAQGILDRMSRDEPSSTLDEVMKRLGVND